MAGTGVPYFPQIMPAGGVVGRLETNPGPTEYISFAVLSAQLSTGLVTSIKTGAGGFSVTATDQLIIINKAAPSATPIALPSVASRGGAVLEVYDWVGNGGDLTFTPNGSDTVMGLASWIVASSSVAPGRIRLIPYISLNGWLVS